MFIPMIRMSAKFHEAGDVDKCTIATFGWSPARVKNLEKL
jgi:hypothetical protein